MERSLLPDSPIEMVLDSPYPLVWINFGSDYKTLVWKQTPPNMADAVLWKEGGYYPRGVYGEIIAVRHISSPHHPRPYFVALRIGVLNNGFIMTWEYGPDPFLGVVPILSYRPDINMMTVGNLIAQDPFIDGRLFGQEEGLITLPYNHFGYVDGMILQIRTSDSDPYKQVIVPLRLYSDYRDTVICQMRLPYELGVNHWQTVPQAIGFNARKFVEKYRLWPVVRQPTEGEMKEIEALINGQK